MTLRNTIALANLAPGSDRLPGASALTGGRTALSAAEGKMLQDLPRAA